MPDYTIGVRVTSQADDRAIKQVTGDLEGLRTKAGSATEGIHAGFTKIIAIAAAAAGSFAALKRIGEEYWEMMKGGIEDLKQEAATGTMVNLFGGATDEQKAGLSGWMASMIQAAGVADDRLNPALRQLLPLTRDLATAQKLIQAASGMAARGIGTFGDNVNSLALMMAGRPIRGAGEFANVLRALGVETGDNASALVTLIDRFGDAGAAADTMALRIERSQAALAQTRDEIGKAISQGGSLIVTFNRIKAEALVNLTVGIMAAAAAVETIIKNIGTLGEMFLALLNKDIQTAVNLAGQVGTSAGEIGAKYQQRIATLLNSTDQLWDSHAQYLLGGTAGMVAEMSRLMEENRRREKEGQDKADAAADKAYKAKLARFEAYYNQYLREKHAREHLAARDEANAAREGAALWESILNDSLNKQTSYSNAQTGVVSQATEAQTTTQVQGINLVVGAMQQAFPESKAFAVAGAIMNTYEAATAALAVQPPWLGIVMAAMIAAAGLAYVAKIESAEPGGGAHGGRGGGPSISRSAAGGGTMGIIRTTEGTPLGGATGMPRTGAAPGSGSQAVSTTAQTININTLTGSDAAEVLRQFERKRLKSAGKLKRTTINRNATTIGRIGG